VCYDLRFPELYRAMGEVDMILVPSAFTETTGKAHWDTLIRARAIENLAYVIAPAQGGYHVNGRETHGHTMIVDPWGVVLDRLPRGSGVVVAGVNPTYQSKIRRSLPALSHKTVRQL
jgi:nitrilase